MSEIIPAREMAAPASAESDAPRAGNAGLSSGLPSESGRLAILDSLRGLAALVVVWHHVTVIFSDLFEPARHEAPFLYSLAQWVSDQNANAVLGFFVISGVSIRLALEKDDLFAPRGIAIYARKRAARILPLYWFALACTAGIGWSCGWRDISFGLTTLLGNLAFLQTAAAAHGNWFDPYGRNGPLWSLSYEVFYYATLPFALRVVAGARALWAKAIDILMLASLAISMAAVALGSVLANPVLSFLSLWAVWCYGFGLGDVLVRGQWRWALAAPLPLAILATWVAWLAHKTSATLIMLASGMIIGALLALTLIGLRHAQPWALAIEKAFVAAFAQPGRGSYALYLLHYPLLLALAQMLHSQGLTGPGASGAVAATLLALTWLICPALERVARRIGRMLFALEPPKGAPELAGRARFGSSFD